VVAGEQMMTPGDRRELRAVVRQRMKVLRADVRLRRTELIAEAEARLAERYREHDKAVEDVNWRIAQVVDAADKDIRELLAQLTAQRDDITLRRISGLLPPRVSVLSEDRAQLHRTLMAGIDAQVDHALAALDRQEADLLQTLALGSLQTDAARGFLAQIPTVAELVPSARLREIEAAFDGRQAQG
jgi:hypothetical protein